MANDIRVVGSQLTLEDGSGRTMSVKDVIDGVYGGLQPVIDGGMGYRLDRDVLANKGPLGACAIDLSFSTGLSTTRGATGPYSTAMGVNTSATGSTSTAMGNYTSATGYASTAMGNHTSATGYASTAMGFSTIATGTGSVAMGFNINASVHYEFSMGVNTKKIRLQMNTGRVYANGGFQASGADYAEMFMSADRTCIQKGRFVSFKENTSDVCPGNNEIVGITSVAPSVMGDAAALNWYKRFLTNEIGEVILTDQVKTEVFTIMGNNDIDINLKETFEEQVHPMYTPIGDWEYKILSTNSLDNETLSYEIEITYTTNTEVENSDYNSSIEYIAREERAEWNEIGMLGKLWVAKANIQGAFTVGDYITSDEDGFAITSTRGEPDSYRVLEVGIEHLRVLFK